MEFVIGLGDGKTVSVPKASVPTHILDIETEVLFLGEGNFTFSFAFACLRGSWDNIVSTAYHNELPSFTDAQVEAIRNVILSHKQRSEIPALEYIDRLSSFSQTPHFCWMHSVDATNIPKELPMSFIWFQCPWVTKWKRTPDMLKTFFEHAGSKQQKDDIIILGIISSPPYCESYALDFLTQGTEYYDFIGADNMFIQEILQRGYRHQGIRDIHRIIYDTHLSLIFKHK